MCVNKGVEVVYTHIRCVSGLCRRYIHAHVHTALSKANTHMAPAIENPSELGAFGSSIKMSNCCINQEIHT